MSDEIREAIEQTVNATVLKMKMAGLLKDDRKTATEKLEELLRLYPTFKKIDGKPQTAKLVEALEEALHSIERDPYFDVLTRFYFNGQTRDFIAQAYGTSVTTISRNKTRLLSELTPQVFSDEVIAEIFL
jgi:DNA-directed RNA polymerase specialized sigma subunit